MTTLSFRQAFDRIYAEYREMPGMHLTADQVQRLCGIDHSVCKVVLDTLVRDKFLRFRADGNYLRVTDSVSEVAVDEVPPLAKPAGSAPHRR